MFLVLLVLNVLLGTCISQEKPCNSFPVLPDGRSVTIEGTLPVPSGEWVMPACYKLEGDLVFPTGRKGLRCIDGVYRMVGKDGECPPIKDCRAKEINFCVERELEEKVKDRDFEAAESLLRFIRSHERVSQPLCEANGECYKIVLDELEEYKTEDFETPIQRILAVDFDEPANLEFDVFINANVRKFHFGNGFEGLILESREVQLNRQDALLVSFEAVDSDRAAVNIEVASCENFDECDYIAKVFHQHGAPKLVHVRVDEEESVQRDADFEQVDYETESKAVERKQRSNPTPKSDSITRILDAQTRRHKGRQSSEHQRWIEEEIAKRERAVEPKHRRQLTKTNFNYVSVRFFVSSWAWLSIIRSIETIFKMNTIYKHYGMTIRLFLGQPKFAFSSSHFNQHSCDSIFNEILSLRDNQGSGACDLAHFIIPQAQCESGGIAYGITNEDMLFSWSKTSSGLQANSLVEKKVIAHELSHQFGSWNCCDDPNNEDCREACSSGNLMWAYYNAPQFGWSLNAQQITQMESFAQRNAEAEEGEKDAQAEADWWHSFNTAGWSTAPGAITGYYKNNCNSIYCLEKVEFTSNTNCKYANVPAVVNWWANFDSAGEAHCPSGAALSGLYRTSGHNLLNIEQAKCCPNTVSTSCQWQSVNSQQGWHKCPANKAIAGFKHNGSDGLNNLTHINCCTITM